MSAAYVHEPILYIHTQRDSSLLGALIIHDLKMTDSENWKRDFPDPEVLLRLCPSFLQSVKFQTPAIFGDFVRHFQFVRFLVMRFPQPQHSWGVWV